METAKTAFLRARKTQLQETVHNIDWPNEVLHVNGSNCDNNFYHDDRRPAVFSAIRNRILYDEDPGNNFHRLYDELQYDHSETENLDVI